ncbi:hypothetical protein COT20_02690 [bacterium (Candidatus Gribaldobacteria) CG08_land_8_20_14_0_20_39_15]|uniref:Uncharacterized protein n=1 Tax=bacterium (Candidatus Gribaldobacteria) CG08_land_8_20_14_0_20_39_15 TaxID=2014273 RepID=A0A2M6XU46_9BACT|nr:MAG: hypothetical protein COT20_02690 [bacterium (Candidatus Gribaldobacteria) CG08_land_8_20_14_0_20_39_15]
MFELVAFLPRKEKEQEKLFAFHGEKAKTMGFFICPSCGKKRWECDLKADKNICRHCYDGE